MSRVTLSQLRLDGGTQTRAEIDLVVAADYADKFRDGVEFPPVVVFYDGADYWLADGFHRVTGARSAGLSELEADVRQGTQDDAIWFSLGANAEWDRVGKKRTRADVQRSIERALRHTNGAGKSDRQIAEHVGCSHVTVGTIRGKLTATGQVDQSTTRTGRDGRTINTANIGKAKPAPQPEPEPIRASEWLDELAEDDADVEREPDVYEPAPAPARIDPPKRDGWGSNELATFAAETVIACRDFQQSIRARFARVDPRFQTEARERAEAVVSETIEALRDLLPSSESARPRFSIVKGGK